MVCWHNGVTANAKVMGSIPTLGDELLFINNFISSLWLPKPQNAVLSSTAQSAVIHEIGGKWERSVLTLGSLGLSCYMPVQREAENKKVK